MALSFLESVKKFNPYHDKKGRFTTAGGAGGGLSAVENEIRNNKHETLVVIGQDGKVKFRKDGGNSEVVLTDSDREAMAGSIITHNHPASNRFSDDDIAVLVSTGAEEIRAVTADGETYSLKRKEGALQQGEKLYSDYFGLAYTKRDEYSSFVEDWTKQHGFDLDSDDPTIDWDSVLRDAKREFSANWLKGAAPDYGYEYSESKDGSIQKANPYHDPKTGRFTTAPGGSASKYSAEDMDKLKSAIERGAIFSAINQRKAMGMSEEEYKEIYNTIKPPKQVEEKPKKERPAGLSNKPTKQEEPAEEDYRMRHRPDKMGSGHDITDADAMPKDFYDHPEWYAPMHEQSYKESLRALRAIRNKPDAEVTIYRAAPKNEFNDGDWVTLSRSYAQTHAESNSNDNNKLQVYSKKVKAKDIQFAGDDINEFGYFPVDGVSKSFTDTIRKYNKWHDPKTGRFTSAPGGASAKKPKANVKIRHDVLDCYGEESYCTYTAYDGENVAGYIKYSRVGDGSPYVQYIETAEEYRGQGVATKLLQQMQHDIGDTEIDFGYTTPDGTKLLEKITYTVTDKKIQDKFDKLERIKSKLKREEKILDDLWEEFDAAVTPEAQEQVRAKIHVHGDKWNQLYDAIPGIERSLEDLKPTKTYIKMDGFETVEKSKSFLDTIKKFNPYHDPKTGRFTSAPGGASSGIMANIAPEFKEAYDKDLKTYEMLGLDPAPLDDKYELMAVLNPGTKVNIGAMPDDLRKQTVSTVKQFINKYPMAKEAITTITVGDHGYTDTFDDDYFKAHPKTMAFYNRDNGVLCLNPSLYDKKSNRASKFEEVYKETVESGYHPQGTDHTSVIVHEMAHAIDNYYSWTNKSNFAAEVKREVSFQASRTKKDFSVNAQKTGLSEYALVNEAEFFAEAIAEYFCSPSPREIATSVGQALDRRMANDQRFKREYENLYVSEKVGGMTIYDRRKT